ncbi:MAG: TrkH family potassium uptake protein [Saprospiraceae bacterium]|nr:TrkH family potassium uptake protein [Saprospiraceae bacterium]
MINFKIVSYIVGVLLILLGGIMLTSLIFSLGIDQECTNAILKASITSSGIGAIIWWFSKGGNKRIGKREGYLIVACGWLSISIFSALPYLFSDIFPSATDAIFESVSGLTTTGATVLNDIEVIPHGLLFWRSLTQWIGGMGIIVLTVAIFPLLGIGGVELFVAEAPGPTSDKIHPRIKETAKRLWFIYVGLTVTLTIILSIGGMSGFDAINHGLTTMATGGFSTKNASMAYFDQPALQYPITFFMFLAGINYTVIYFGLKGKLKKVWQSDEFKAYLLLVAILIIYITITHYNNTDHDLETSFRYVSLQVISIITTTGYVTMDYTSVTPSITIIFFTLLFLGACAGSTSGGIKIIRHVTLLKNSVLEFKRILHPKAVIRIKVDQKLVPGRIMTHILVFFLLYLTIFVVGSAIMSVILKDFNQPLLTSMGAVATSLGNVGPAIAELGPMDNFSSIPALGKWFLLFIMLLGRLELFTILIIFTPYFWRMN